jgi:PAS domain S-box-containing protein
MALMQAHLEKRVPYNTEFRIRRQDGTYCWAHATGQAIWDASGKPQRMVGTLDDITQRKRTEATLRAVVDHAVDGLITIDARGNVESFYPACERIFGYASREVLGKNIKVLMPEPYHSEHDGYLSHYVATGEARIIGTAGREVSGRRKDGSIFPMDLSVSAFQLEDGRHYSGIIRDITERKAAEREIKENAMRFKGVIDSILDGLITINSRAVIESFNPAAERIFGYTSAEALGQNVKMLMPEPVKLCVFNLVLLPI